MKLYTGPLSLFSAKVRIALAEKGLAYEHVSVGWSPRDRYQPHHPEVVARNPKRQVPVLVDGDVVVCDSTRILEYLEDRHPAPPLMPATPAGRARCRELEAFGDEIFFPPLWDLIEEVFYPAGAAGRDARRLARAREEIARHHATLERELAGRDYLCDAFGIADIGVFVMLSAAASFGAAPSADRPNLLAWLARTGGRPAVKADVEAMTAYVAGLAGERAAPAA